MTPTKSIGFTALSLLLLTRQSIGESTFLPPTATEIFHLRSQCAALGKKIFDSSVAGPALYKSQMSRYTPQTNRCYVELTVQTADTTTPLRYLSRYLYDGQTGEMLAAAQIKEGKKWGMVYDQSYQTKTLENAGWDDASEYVNVIMTDDRKN